MSAFFVCTEHYNFLLGPSNESLSGEKKNSRDLWDSPNKSYVKEENEYAYGLCTNLTSGTKSTFENWLRIRHYFISNIFKICMTMCKVLLKLNDTE